MKDEQRIKVLEDELKVLKNEIKAVLLDLREQYLNLQNPFNCNMTSGTGHGIRESKLELQEYGAETDEQNDLVNETNAGTMIPEVKTRDSQVNSPASFAGAAKGGKQMSLPKTPGEAAGLLFRDNERMEESSRAEWNGAGHLWHQLTGQNKEQIDDEQPADITTHLFKRSNEQDFAPNHGKVDLVVIAGLTQWVDQATSKLGRERTEIIVEMSYAMGHLPEKLKDAVIRMVRLSPNESKSQKMAASDYLELLAQLENLLGNSRQQEKALLSIISMMKDSKDG
jgi:hypothetical protein